MKYHFKNLVFEGGGVKGIAYIGAMDVLQKKQILPDIKRVGGTSAGAINALLFGLGYTNAETREIFLNMDFDNFLDDKWGIARDTKRLIKEFGWYKGDSFKKWIKRMISYKTGNPNTTFADLKAEEKTKGYRELYFVGTNISTGYSEIFSYEHTPDMKLADAVRISMSIPLFFTAVKSGGNVYVDGGLLNNYPIKIFDREGYIDNENASLEVDYYTKHNADLTENPYLYNKETLGFKLDNSKEIGLFKDGEKPPSRKVKHIFHYIKYLIDTLVEFQSNQHMHGDDWQRTIYVDTLGVKTTDFDITKEQKLELIESGRVNTEKYFEWFEDKENDVVNRVVFS